MSEGPSDYVVDQGFGLMPKDDDNQQQQPEVTPQQEPQQQPSINPAWTELLSQVPENFHPALTPHLKKWDDNYRGLQEVHSRFEPYKPFIEQGIDPEALNNAILVQQSLEADPHKFVQAVAEFYGLQLGEQGQETVPQDDEEIPFDITQHPEFQRITGLTETMAKALLAQNEQAEAAAAEQQLDQEFAEAKGRHGEFDENFVARLMYVDGLDIDAAVAAYQEFVNNVVQNHQSPGAKAPVLMGGGGGLPSQATPVRNLTGQQRRALLVQALTNAENAGG